MADILSSITSTLTSGLKNIGQQNNQFRTVAAQQNSSIGRFIKDIGKYFAMQSQQQNSMNNAIGDLQQATAANSARLDQTNSLLRESISVQNEMLVELRSVSGSFKTFTRDFEDNQRSGNSLLSTIVSILSGAAVGAAATAGIEAMGGLGPLSDTIRSTAGSMSSGVGNLLGRLGLGGGGGGEQPQGGNADTVGASQRGTSGGNVLSVAQMVKIAKDAGFTQEQAVIMGAIGGAESSGNPFAHNTRGRDNSYGIWQINMKDDLGPQRREQYNLSSNEDLYNATINAKIAKDLFDQAGGFTPWGAFTDGRYAQFLGTARRSVESGTQTATGMEGDGDVLPSSGAVDLQKYSLKPPSHVEGLDSGFKSKLSRFFAAAEASGHPLRLYSGYRDINRQKELWAGALAKYGSPEAARKWVAPPGKSRHNFGLAADLATASGAHLGSSGTAETTQWAHQNASKYGLNFRLSNEAWHIEPSGGNSGMMMRASQGVGDVENGLSTDSYGGGGASLNGSGGLESAVSAFSGTEFAPLSGILGSILGATSTMTAGLSGLTGAIGLGGAMGSLGGMFGGLQSVFQGIPNMFGAAPQNNQSNEKENPNLVEADGDSLPATKKVNTIQSAAAQSDSMMFNVASSLQNQNTNKTVETPHSTSLPIRGDQGRYSISGGLTSSTSWYQQLAGKINYDEVMKLKGGVYA